MHVSTILDEYPCLRAFSTNVFFPPRSLASPGCPCLNYQDKGISQLALCAATAWPDVSNAFIKAL